MKNISIFFLSAFRQDSIYRSSTFTTNEQNSDYFVSFIVGYISWPAQQEFF